MKTEGVEMTAFPIGLKEVDRVEIMSLMDNYVDLLLEDTEIAKRPPLTDRDELPKETLHAEHGLSLLIKVESGSESHTVLLDTGYSKTGLLHNMKMLHVNTGSIEAIVISHAHMDHNGSLLPLLDKMSQRPAIVIHPHAFHYPRFLKDTEGKITYFPRVLIKDELKKREASLLINDGPTLIVDDMVGVTGAVERKTHFEKGMPNGFIEIDGRTECDTVKDDQAVIINLRGSGLVVISGCSHSGIINTLLFAQKITGIKRIYGVLGGFHLTGQLPEHVIDETIDELKKLNPEVIVPMHCTGWSSIKRIEAEFPNAFVMNSVGTRYIL
jgi:7,8-dihydropterin-6-yl-methyl-4-(beta-D-ribofuranosyl)aminobenzene 5'-phosphate synthase